MSKTLVIVESPTKAKTITKFLGKDFVIKASNGHIRDLPNSATEIPANIKKEAWTKLGINVNQDFEPLYIIPPSKKQNVKDLKDALKGATALFLATDEDREGESISWHLVETLNPKIPVKRMVFHEITKEAIQEAINSPRDIDFNLVKAQETRRIVDRLYGYSVSPILWKKMAPGLSAGRVQSVAIKLLVEREQERMKFKAAEFWGLTATFSKISAPGTFDAELTHVGDKKVATGKDFDPNTGKLTAPDNTILLSEDAATKLREKLLKSDAKVASVEEKPFVSKPSAPFVTSTLQQEGNRKLRFSAKRTMQIAQQLYENGFITYMRTDSTTLSNEALNGARTLILRDFGKEFLPDQARVYTTKVKNAQEAHEAIRPAGASFTPPEKVREALNDEAFRLYELIWKRTVASQMTDARGTYINVSVTSADAKFRASGKTIEFPGFLRAYVEGSDDPESELADQERVLPKLANGEAVKSDKVDAASHTTQPPPRFTEGSLIKELERLGIGRPSTWATIVELVLSRSYAFKRGNALVPTFTAMGVVRLLSGHFANIVDYKFTARLEDDLDAISRGEAGNLQYLKDFYFGNGHPGLKTLVETGEKGIDPKIVCGMPLGKKEDGTDVEVRIGRYGPFVSDGTQRASVPDLVTPDELTLEHALQLLAVAAKGPTALGTHPESGLPIYLKTGRFGPYVQLGDMVDGGDKPKMASLLAGTKEDEVDLEHALKLLALPKTLGLNPENQEPIIAANGRFGPYIKCGAETRSINLEGVTPISITMEQAIELLKQPKGMRRGAQPKSIKEVGVHPVSQAKLMVFSGRYGPYVTDGKINASLPKGQAPEGLTVEDAVNLLEARAARLASGEVPRRGRGRKSAGGAKVAKEPKAAKAPKTPKAAGGKGKKKKGSTEPEAASGGA